MVSSPPPLLSAFRAPHTTGVSHARPARAAVRPSQCSSRARTYCPGKCKRRAVQHTRGQTTDQLLSHLSFFPPPEGWPGPDTISSPWFASLVGGWTNGKKLREPVRPRHFLLAFLTYPNAPKRGLRLKPCQLTTVYARINHSDPHRRVMR